MYSRIQQSSPHPETEYSLIETSIWPITDVLQHLLRSFLTWPTHCSLYIWWPRLHVYLAHSQIGGWNGFNNGIPCIPTLYKGSTFAVVDPHNLAPVTLFLVFTFPCCSG
ncbi:hypothetical protein M413DRAFT_261670 [Hebeloma cylindrosporum]|uniref:Uncharacterized protein n=1 Tax=Hebeloma cylindrosporum TaxID=76867 RepID=A0A0C3CRP6_HEBCY|nr:hypothetical protein M413DRAFT_261670 [Hebeloma cylindrosporum h7]